MLETLPSELLDRIFSHLSCTENAHVRLVNRKLNTHAISHTFCAAWIYGDEKPFASPAYRALSTKPELARHVRHLTIETHPIPEDLEALLELVGAGIFPRLRSVTIAFPGGTVFGVESSEGTWGDVDEECQDIWERAEVLETVFAALSKCTTVRVLTLLNLQNYHVPAVEPYLAPVLSRLHGLHMAVLGEHSSDGQGDYEHHELFDFFARLPALWLAHCQPQLRALSLGNSDFFGFLPPLDLRALRFTVLRRLEMINWTLSHEWQVTSFLNAATLPELRTLQLVDCPIMYGARVDRPLSADGYPVAGNGICRNWAPLVQFERRWAWVFDQLRTGLPKLVELRIAASRIDRWDPVNEATVGWFKALGVWRDILSEGEGAYWEAWLPDYFYEAGYDKAHGKWYITHEAGTVPPWLETLGRPDLDEEVPLAVFGSEDMMALERLVEAMKTRRRR
ncbi:hypothetical protein EDC01DRAFT_664350 [Geopyxis carbonaria]|nr:hypothetical protein EDC01DRAFT_664350 [Geopyxis carbonaria]